MSGWIKLHREIMNKAIWQCGTIEQRVILVTLLLMANHEEKQWEWNGQKFICQPGQFVTSLQAIASKAGVSIQNTRTALERFEKYDFLTSKVTNKNRLITISNWASYQVEEEQLTSNQQASNKQVTTNKKDKNKNKYISPSKISVPEDFQITERIERWATEGNFTRSQMEHQIPYFIEKHKALGSKYTDWESAFQTWMRNARDWGKLPASKQVVDDKHATAWANLLKFPYVRSIVNEALIPTSELMPIAGRPSERMFKGEALGWQILEGVQA